MNGSVGPFLRKELREILRDRKTVFRAFLLPIFVYPVMFSFTSFLDDREADRAEDLVHRVAVTGAVERIVGAVEADESLELVDPPSLDPEDLRAAVRDGELQAWVDVGDTTRVVFHAPHEESRKARDRLGELLADEGRDESRRRFREAGGTYGLGEPVVLEEIDVASEAEAGGATAGRLVPFLLVMTLFIGGSAISTDMVAGEKERGTLETLYLTPVRREVIARAKFFVVAIATIISGGLNFASMLLCYRLGWIGEGAGIVISSTGILTAAVLIVPLGALVGGVLLGISAQARSLKEAQYYLTPAMMLAFLPGLLSMSQDIALGPLTALLPIANVTLALRDGLVGPVPAGLLALVTASSIAWGWLVMRWTAGVLSREETILGFDPEPFLAPTRTGRRRAVLLGMSVTVLAFFYVGGLIQARALIPGLVLSLWVLLPVCAAGTLRIAWSGGELRDVLSWRRPRPGALLGGLLIGGGTVIPMLGGLVPLQNLFLPSPEGLTEALSGGLSDLSPLALFFLLALSPGICEELVFRGAFFGLLRRVGSGRWAVLVSAAFFGAVHLSIYRFLPTALLGVVFALVVRRTRTIFPAMIAHATYNGLIVLGGAEDGWLANVDDAVGWTASLAALALGVLLVRRSPSD